MNCVRFVSINDDFDTVNGLTDQSHPHGARIRIPIKNAFNEQVAVEIKQKVEATLQMKIDRGTLAYLSRDSGIFEREKCGQRS